MHKASELLSWERGKRDRQIWTVTHTTMRPEGASSCANRTGMLYILGLEGSEGPQFVGAWHARSGAP